jgi:O-antigen polysaccharide polymerase Wzy
MIRVGYAFFTFAFLSAAVPVLLATGIHTHATGVLNFLPFAIVFYGAVRLAILAGGREPRFASLTFWVFVYCFLGVAPLLQAASGALWRRGQTADEIALTVGIVLVGLVAFDFGQLFSRLRGTGQAARVATLTVVGREFVPSRLVLLAVAGIVSFAVAVSLFGWREFLVGSRAQVFESFVALKGEGQVPLELFSSAIRMPIFVAALGLLAVVARKGSVLRAFEARAFGVFSFGVIGMALLTNNPINAPRYLVSSMVLSMMFVLLARRWRQPYMAILILGLVSSVLVLFPMLDAFRYSVSDPLVYGWDMDAIAMTIVEKGDFDAFQQLMNAISYVEEEGASFGKQLLGAALFFVPRFFWIEKPIATGMLIAEWQGYEYTNLSCPLWAELYVDFGVWGVFVGFFIYGLVSRIFERTSMRLLRDRGEEVAIAALAIWAAYQFFILRGSLMPALAYFSPIALGLWMVSRDPKERWIPAPRIRMSG